jgi:hypothetical protein
MRSAVGQIEKTYLSFRPRPAGNYTIGQLSKAAAYTLFCHSEIEGFLEAWASLFTSKADDYWRSQKITRPLLHLCTFHGGRGELKNIPSKDIWSEIVVESIRKHQRIITSNNGIKEQDVARMFSPIGFDTRTLDAILLSDLSSFGTLRGGHAHRAHNAQLAIIFDPFDRRQKVLNLLNLLQVFDSQLLAYKDECF